MVDFIALLGLIGGVAHVLSPWFFLKSTLRVGLVYAVSLGLFIVLLFGTVWIHATYFITEIGDDGSGIGSAILFVYVFGIGMVSFALAMAVAALSERKRRQSPEH